MARPVRWSYARVVDMWLVYLATEKLYTPREVAGCYGATQENMYKLFNREGLHDRRPPSRAKPLTKWKEQEVKILHKGYIDTEGILTPEEYAASQKLGKNLMYRLFAAWDCPTRTEPYRGPRAKRRPSDGATKVEYGGGKETLRPACPGWDLFCAECPCPEPRCEEGQLPHSLAASPEWACGYCAYAYVDGDGSGAEQCACCSAVVRLEYNWPAEYEKWRERMHRAAIQVERKEAEAEHVSKYVPDDRYIRRGSFAFQRH